MVGQIYPTELQLNKAKSSDTEAPFLDLNLSITIISIVSSKIYDKRDDFNFETVNFPFLDGDVPRSPSYGVYISQLIRFVRVCSNVNNFNNRNLFFNAKLLKQGYNIYMVALLNLSSWWRVMVERLFLAVPRGCLQFVIVVFPDHTHLLFFIIDIIKFEKHFLNSTQTLRVNC